jgi:hypothetical protein
MENALILKLIEIISNPSNQRIGMAAFSGAASTFNGYKIDHIQMISESLIPALANLSKRVDQQSRASFAINHLEATNDLLEKNPNQLSHVLSQLQNLAAYQPSHTAYLDRAHILRNTLWHLYRQSYSQHVEQQNIIQVFTQPNTSTDLSWLSHLCFCTYLDLVLNQASFSELSFYIKLHVQSSLKAPIIVSQDIQNYLQVKPSQVLMHLATDDQSVDQTLFDLMHQESPVQNLLTLDQQDHFARLKVAHQKLGREDINRRRLQQDSKANWQQTATLLYTTEHIIEERINAIDNKQKTLLYQTTKRAAKSEPSNQAVDFDELAYALIITGCFELLDALLAKEQDSQLQKDRVNLAYQSRQLEYYRRSYLMVNGDMDSLSSKPANDNPQDLSATAPETERLIKDQDTRPDQIDTKSPVNHQYALTNEHTQTNRFHYTDYILYQTCCRTLNRGGVVFNLIKQDEGEQKWLTQYPEDHHSTANQLKYFFSSDQPSLRSHWFNLEKIQQKCLEKHQQSLFAYLTETVALVDEETPNYPRLSGIFRALSSKYQQTISVLLRSGMDIGQQLDLFLPIKSNKETYQYKDSSQLEKQSKDLRKKRQLLEKQHTKKYPSLHEVTAQWQAKCNQEDKLEQCIKNEIVVLADLKQLGESYQDINKKLLNALNADSDKSTSHKKVYEKQQNETMALNEQFRTYYRDRRYLHYQQALFAGFEPMVRRYELTGRYVYLFDRAHEDKEKFFLAISQYKQQITEYQSAPVRDTAITCTSVAAGAGALMMVTGWWITGPICLIASGLSYGTYRVRENVTVNDKQLHLTNIHQMVCYTKALMVDGHYGQRDLLAITEKKIKEVEDQQPWWSLNYYRDNHETVLALTKQVRPIQSLFFKPNPDTQPVESADQIIRSMQHANK